jgi:hypothetical protein
MFPSAAKPSVTFEKLHSAALNYCHHLNADEDDKLLAALDEVMGLLPKPIVLWLKKNDPCLLHTLAGELPKPLLAKKYPVHTYRPKTCLNLSETLSPDHHNEEFKAILVDIALTFLVNDYLYQLFRDMHKYDNWSGPFSKVSELCRYNQQYLYAQRSLSKIAENFVRPILERVLELELPLAQCSLESSATIYLSVLNKCMNVLFSCPEALVTAGILEKVCEEGIPPRYKLSAALESECKREDDAALTSTSSAAGASDARSLAQVGFIGAGSAASAMPIASAREAGGAGAAGPAVQMKRQ